MQARTTKYGEFVAMTGIQTTWLDNAQTILTTQIGDIWSWEDVDANASHLGELATSVSYPIGLMVTIPRTISLPPSGFNQYSRQLIAHHATLGIHTVIYIARIPYTVILWQEIIDAFADDSDRYFIVGTQDEALNIIRSRQ